MVSLESSADSNQNKWLIKVHCGISKVQQYRILKPQTPGARHRGVQISVPFLGGAKQHFGQPALLTISSGFGPFGEFPMRFAPPPLWGKVRFARPFGVLWNPYTGRNKKLNAGSHQFLRAICWGNFLFPVWPCPPSPCPTPQPCKLLFLHQTGVVLRSQEEGKVENSLARQGVGKGGDRNKKQAVWATWKQRPPEFRPPWLWWPRAGVRGYRWVGGA